MTTVALSIWIIAVILMITVPLSAYIGRKAGSPKFQNREWVTRYRNTMNVVICSLTVIAASLLFFFS